jgi:hypothetical protein
MVANLIQAGTRSTHQSPKACSLIFTLLLWGMAGLPSTAEEQAGRAQHTAAAAAAAALVRQQQGKGHCTTAAAAQAMETVATAAAAAAAAIEAVGAAPHLVLPHIWCCHHSCLNTAAAITAA